MTPDRAASVLAVPLSVLYGVAVRLRTRYYDRHPAAARSAGVPVISVGNLTVGGTGKTPLVTWLAGRLLERGLPVAVVSRGYGGTAGRGPLLVSVGHGPVVSAAACGDEPFLLATRLPGALVIVGADRVAAARLAASRGARAVVLDDGFQHRRLARDLDLVLLEASRPLAAERLLPAGVLREPPSSLRRADVVVATRCRVSSDLQRFERDVRALNPRALVIGSVTRFRGFADARGRPAPPPRLALAFCAIGNPAAFREDLAAQGVRLVGFHAFRDHHRYTSGELARLWAEAGRSGAELVTTEKDLARLGPMPGDPRADWPLALRIDLEPSNPDGLLNAVASVVEGSRR
jgi:tetraacyldisaccharide 4'-kinase